MFRMQPVAHEGLPCRGFALRNFVFVVRKCQVYSTGVNIQGLAQIFHGHGGALNVPAGPSAANRGFLEVFSRFWRFLKRKIPRDIFLYAIVITMISTVDSV